MERRSPPADRFTPKCAVSLGNLQQVVLVAAGVLAVLDLLLPPLQNGSVGLRVGRVREAVVAAAERRPAEVGDVRKHDLPTRVEERPPDLLLSMSSVPTATLLVDTFRMQRSKMDGLSTKTTI